MRSTTESSRSEVGNGGDATAPAIVQEEELLGLPRDELPQHGTGTRVTCDTMTNELLLDGSARLNLATFVTTWMPPDAARLMAETADKNMIDKDEYPQTAEFERRCVNIVVDCGMRPEPGDVTGTSTTGSSEAAMLGGMALKWRWRERMKAAGKPTDRPNLVTGINVQVCWDKFCRYWDIEPRLVPMDGDRYLLNAEEAVALRDENTIGVVAVLRSTFDSSCEPVSEICAALDELAAGGGPDVPVHVDGASGGFVAPFVQPELEWDFRLPRVQSINASGHGYGLVYPGVGWRSGAVGRSATGSRVRGELSRWEPAHGCADLPASGKRGDCSVLHVRFAGGGRIPARSSGRRARSPSTSRGRRGHRTVPADHTWQRPAGGCVHGRSRGQQLHRVRRVSPAP